MKFSPTECQQRFTAARVARLATVDERGQPHLVPITFAVVDSCVATAIDHKPKRTTAVKRLRNIRANPRVSLLVDHYDDDWTRLWWVRADGQARVTEAEAERDQPLRELAAKYEQYRQRVPDGPVVLVDVDRWTGWAYSG